MQCISAVKLTKVILNVCIFRESSCPINCLLPGLRPSDRLLPKKSTSVFRFLALGASLPLVTPISGYAYARISNNKQ